MSVAALLSTDQSEAAGGEHAACVVCANVARKDGRLGQDYLDKNIPVVNERLTMAGVRLAALLNAVFDDTKELPF